MSEKSQYLEKVTFEKELLVIFELLVSGQKFSCCQFQLMNVFFKIILAFVVRPQPITETSLIDSVAGFINEVQSLHHHSGQSQTGDDKVHVTWAKFERTDINDTALFSEQMEINGRSKKI